MSDSFTEMVERYRKELAQYGAQAAKSSPGTEAARTTSLQVPLEPGPVIPEKSEPQIPLEPGPVIPEKSEPQVPLEPGPVIPEKSEPQVPLEPGPVIPEKSEPQVPLEPGPVIPEKSEPQVPLEPGPVTLRNGEQNGTGQSKLCHPDDIDTATLVVQVFTARQAIPVPDANVTVYCGDDITQNVLIAFRTTNVDGKTDPLLLAAPSRAYSESPNPPETPYAVYRVRIDHPEYISVTLEDVQMFGGVESILPVELTPYIPIDEPKPLRSVALPDHTLSTDTEANES